jgi:arylsulfatase A-like enzyme
MHYEDYPITIGQVVLTSSLGRAITNNRLFRRLINYHDMLNDKDAERVNADFLKWLEKDERKPFFAFLNYYDAHEPYLPPQGFAGRFGPSGPRGNFKYFTNDIEREKKWTMTKEDVEIEEAAYEGSIAYLDFEISQLMKNLESRGILQNTLVIITSDHGEQFGERPELFGHGNSLYFSALHVPLLFFFPSSVPSGERVSEPVSLRSIPHTVAQVLRLEDSSFFPGDSLTRYWDESAQNDKYDEPVISEMYGGFGEPWYPIAKGNLKSLVLPRYHLIRNGDGGTELYDFEKDPFELQNLANTSRSAQILNEFNNTGEVSAAIHP